MSRLEKFPKLINGEVLNQNVQDSQINKREGAEVLLNKNGTIKKISLAILSTL